MRGPSMISRRATARVSISLILSYVLDWIVLIAAAGIATWLATISPIKRPFSLANPEISFPSGEDTVSTLLLVVIGLFAPAAVILLVCLIFVPGPTVPKSVPQSLIWKRKLWEWHTGWLGLALSLASAWLLTSSVKNLIGKPRPDLIDRCMPDLENFTKYVITGFPISPDNSALVSHLICTNPDKSYLDDGWRSFPSGHSSFSAAGLVYLSLFLSSKFAIMIPFLSSNQENTASVLYSAYPSRASTAQKQSLSAYPILPTTGSHSKDSSSNTQEKLPLNHDRKLIAARNQAASPPIYLLLIAFLPSAGALYVAASRFPDFRHHGFDVLSGFTIGVVCAIFAFRYYHLPISRGAGWSWGPRSRSRAWWAGVGVGTYVGNEEGDRKRRDEEAAIMSDAVMMDDLHGSEDAAHDNRDRREMNLNGHGRADGSRERETVGGPSNYSRTNSQNNPNSQMMAGTAF